ncbi:glycosyltransferase family 9 protein [Thermodesulfobacteriota bacterium]
MEFKTDCVHYIGDKPCRFNRLCDGCGDYEPMGTRILIIKLASIGDVLRTTPLLHALSREYPGNHTTWLVDRSAEGVLAGNRLIHRLLPMDLDATLRLRVERFDIAINMDKDIRAAAVMAGVDATVKIGFTLGPDGGVRPLNAGSEYHFALGLSDELKFRMNKKTYQELVYESVGIPYSRDEYIYSPGPEAREYAEQVFRDCGLDRGGPVVGLNTGCGPVFATKKWPIEGFASLSDLIGESLGGHPVLLGGPDERSRNREIQALTSKSVPDAGTHHSIHQFAAIVGLCDILVTVDTLAMHLAIALKCPAVVLFGPTCHQEVDLYDRGAKLFVDEPCSPCYRGSCPESKACMTRITPEAALEAVRKVLKTA